MHVVIQKDLFERSRQTFEAAHEITCIPVSVNQPDRMIAHHKTDDARCLIIGAETYPISFYESLKRGSLIIRCGVGYDAVPVDRCRERGILVANTPGTLDDSVAEHALALMFAAARLIPQNDKAIRRGNWPSNPGMELNGKTLAVLGFGNIGSKTAQKASAGLGMAVIAFGRRGSITSPIPAQYTTDLRAALRDADIVSLHLSVNSDTRHIINENTINMMKPGAMLINTARGALVNERDLYDALVAGTISCAALDVFGEEPYKPGSDSDLRKLPNIILTPHTGSNTDGSNMRMAQACIRTVLNFHAHDMDNISVIPELRELIGSAYGITDALGPAASESADKKQ